MIFVWDNGEMPDARDFHFVAHDEEIVSRAEVEDLVRAFATSERRQQGFDDDDLCGGGIILWANLVEWRGDDEDLEKTWEFFDPAFFTYIDPMQCTPGLAVHPALWRPDVVLRLRPHWRNDGRLVGTRDYAVILARLLHDGLLVEPA